MPDYKKCTGSCGRRLDGGRGTSEDLLGVGQAGDGKASGMDAAAMFLDRFRHSQRLEM